MKKHPFAAKNLIYSYISDENVFFAITFSLSFMLGAPSSASLDSRSACCLRRLLRLSVRGFIVVPWQHPRTPFAKSLRSIISRLTISE
jgi:hypothetical protein